MLLPKLFKELYEYVSACKIFQTRSLQKIKQPLQETDITPYPMAKISLDLSGPYPTSMSENKYIIAFVDWFIGWQKILLYQIKLLIQSLTCCLKKFSHALAIVYN